MFLSSISIADVAVRIQKFYREILVVYMMKDKFKWINNAIVLISFRSLIKSFTF